MRKPITVLLVLVTLSFSTIALAQQGGKTAAKPTAGSAKKLTEQQKIDLLINYVRNLQGATFIRNGDEYPAKDAAEHLQLKRRKAGDKVKTAREFIDGLASESYISGKPYHIRMKDGKTYLSRDILMKELERIEKQN